MHSEIMIQFFISAWDRTDKLSSLFIEYFSRRIKREKLTILLVRHITIGNDSRRIIQGKCIRIFVKFRKVLLTVIVVMSVLIQLQKSLYILISSFPFPSILLPVHALILGFFSSP